MRTMYAITVLLITASCTSNSSTCPNGSPDVICVCPDGTLGKQPCQAQGGTAACICNQPDGPPAPKRRIFVTILSYPVDFMGLQGADGICNGVASGGKWTAWMSDSSHDAFDRIADLGPWFRTFGGTGPTDNSPMIFRDKMSLKGAPSRVIDYDEHGNQLDAADTDGVWTGTENGGTGIAGMTCADWKQGTTDGTDSGLPAGRVGNPRSQKDWTSARSSACSERNHIYCLEQ